MIRYLSICEERTIQAMYSIGREATLQEIVTAVNKIYGTEWSERAVKYFLYRLEWLECIALEKRKVQGKWRKEVYYSTLFTPEEVEVVVYKPWED